MAALVDGWRRFGASSRGTGRKETRRGGEVWLGQLRQRALLGLLGVSPREKMMGRGKRRRNRDRIRATWPREGIECARAESEDRRRPTRGVAGDDAVHGMGARTVHWRAQ